MILVENEGTQEIDPYRYGCTMSFLDFVNSHSFYNEFFILKMVYFCAHNLLRYFTLLFVNLELSGMVYINCLVKCSNEKIYYWDACVVWLMWWLTLQIYELFNILECFSHILHTSPVCIAQLDIHGGYYFSFFKWSKFLSNFSLVQEVDFENDSAFWGMCINKLFYLLSLFFFVFVIEIDVSFFFKH